MFSYIWCNIIAHGWGGFIYILVSRWFTTFFKKSWPSIVVLVSWLALKSSMLFLNFPLGWKISELKWFILILYILYMNQINRPKNLWYLKLDCYEKRWNCTILQKGLPERQFLGKSALFHYHYSWCFQRLICIVELINRLVLFDL